MITQKTGEKQNVNIRNRMFSALTAGVVLFLSALAAEGLAENNEYTVFLSDTGIVTDCASASVHDACITLTAAGTYRVSGSLSDGQILIDASDDDKVKLILDNAEITCRSAPAIYVVNAKKLVLSSEKDSVNTICSHLVSVSDETADAAVFSHDDLTLSGVGCINIAADSCDGIVSKDKLKVKSGIVRITAGGKGLVGKDAVTMEGGTLCVASEDDAIHSNDEILMQGGEAVISTEDDGMHADKSLRIEGGSVNMDACYEGLEALSVQISGGKITIHAADDGINAAGGNDDSNSKGRFGGDQFQADDGAEVCIAGGELLIIAEGDGIDSNGSISMSGGTVYISGPANSANGALDCASSAEISGGIIVAAGDAGMAEGFDSSSAQGNILYGFPAHYPAGTVVTLESESGDVLASYTPEKSFSSVAVSAPGLKSSGTYRLVVGTDEYSIEMNGITYSNGRGHFGPGGEMPPQFLGDFGGKEGFSGERPAFHGTPPEGMPPERMSPDGLPPEGLPFDGMPFGGTPPMGEAPDFTPPEKPMENYR